ncbi:MAG: hypothetical protein QNJ32_22110 [Xenococcaceae cyanobacterium MO_167.B27]|nr:hypothetical protein [Xenococcaceae cyanobacterium MO_167.B27]
MLTIELIEYQSQSYPRHKITEQDIAIIRQQYPSQVRISLQDTKQGDCWKFTAQGWIGYIPVSSNLAIRITPKVAIANLLGMLEYAYNLKSFRFLDGVTNCGTLEDFYNRLVQLLCNKILVRCRQGLSKKYVTETRQLNYVRGRLHIKQTLKKPWDIRLTCNYQQQTNDIPETQILLWTLHLISRHSLCSVTVKSLVRKTYHTLHSSVILNSFTVSDLDNFQYNRLNQDYQQLHSLCRFFLTNSMPSNHLGNNEILPFLVNMANLYEKFVAEWLKLNLGDRFNLRIQKTVNLTSCEFKIDLLIEDTITKQILYVLDTKYKNSDTPSNSDIYQIVTYATSQKCSHARLIYPQQLKQPLRDKIGNIQVKSLVFSLEDDLEQSGKNFLQDLFHQ